MPEKDMASMYKVRTVIGPISYLHTLLYITTCDYAVPGLDGDRD